MKRKSERERKSERGVDNIFNSHVKDIFESKQNSLQDKNL